VPHFAGAAFRTEHSKNTNAMFHEVWELERFQTAKGHSRALAMVPFDRPHAIFY